MKYLNIIFDFDKNDPWIFSSLSSINFLFTFFSFDYLKFFKLYTLREMTIHRIMSKKSYSNENFEIDEFEKIMSLSKE